MSTSIEYVTGDATEPHGDGLKIIAHICNDVGVWGAGFVMALSARWPEPEAAYRAWSAGHQPALYFGLGAVQFVRVAPGLQVANMVAQQGLGEDGQPAVRYEALAVALSKVAVQAIPLEASVHMPRIGCGLAGGTWEMVEPLITDHLCMWDIPVTVYDIPPEDAADAALARAARRASSGEVPWEQIKAEMDGMQILTPDDFLAGKG
jgi:O-acetyl-ADP-ribose deacetylase (regulator of RNase III)